MIEIAQASSSHFHHGCATIKIYPALARKAALQHNFESNYFLCINKSSYQQSKLLLSLIKRRNGALVCFSRGFGKDYTVQDEVRQQRQQQIAATDLLAKLLQAEGDAKAVATEYIDSLTEEFFFIGSGYLQLSEKEGDSNVTEKIRGALQAAMEVKQSTLRLEIQLLNKLLAASTPLQRKQILNTKQSGEQLIMNDGYFFTLLNRMTSDVSMQPDTPAKETLLEQLAAIKEEAIARLPPTSK